VALVQSGQQVQEPIMLVVVLVVVILLELHIQQELEVLVVVGMEAIVLSTQQVGMQHLTLVEAVVLETLRRVIQKGETAVLAS
jgi:hypothetical protein